MPRFNAANAAEYGKRGNAAKIANAELARQQLAEQEEQAKQLPEEASVYVSKRLVRVRLQLDRIDAMVLKEKDAQKLDRLASAQARLADQERKLAGRPDPGSYRPTQKPERSKPSLGPLD